MISNVCYIALFNLATIAVFGTAPMIRSISFPFLKISIVGMLEMLYSAATRGFSSTLSFAIR